jgi:hypothetical protein
MMLALIPIDPFENEFTPTVYFFLIYGVKSSYSDNCSLCKEQEEKRKETHDSNFFRFLHNKKQVYNK